MFDHQRALPHDHLLRWRHHRAIRRVVTGLALILFGVGWLLKGQGLISREDLWLVAPAVIAIGSLARLAFYRDAGSVVRAVLGLSIAAYLVVVIEHVGGLTFATTWPVLLIAAGLASISRALFGRGAGEEPNW